MDPHQLNPESRFHQLMARQLAGSLPKAEAEELERMLQADPGLMMQADLLEAMWQEDQQPQPAEDVKEAFVRHLLQHRDEFIASEPISIPVLEQEQRTPRMSWRLYTAAAVLVVLLGIVIWMSNILQSKPTEKNESTPMMEVVVQHGKKEIVNLPDGSRVWLNAGSTLQYRDASFLGERREVTLSGEAFFDITHDAERPFYVRSGQVQIRVLGTAFNVKAYPDDQSVETSLIRGSVQVMLKDRPDDVYILRPNEKLVISNRLPAAVQQQPDISGLLKESSPLVSLRNVTVADSGKLIQETAWVQNKLVFRDEAFASLAQRMERWYGVKIHLERDGVDDLAFTGIFTTETIVQALRAMQLVHPFSFRQENEHIYIQ